MSYMNAAEVANKFFNPDRPYSDDTDPMTGNTWRRWAFGLTAKQWAWLIRVSDNRETWREHGYLKTQGQFERDGKTYFYFARELNNKAGMLEVKTKVVKMTESEKGLKDYLCQFYLDDDEDDEDDRQWILGLQAELEEGEAQFPVGSEEF